MHDNLDSARRRLTESEVAILEMLAFGQSTKQIAHCAEMAPRTVERVIERVRLRLNARNRAHLVTMAIQLGLLSVEGPRRTTPLRTGVSR